MEQIRAPPSQMHLMHWSLLSPVTKVSRVCLYAYPNHDSYMNPRKLRMSSVCILIHRHYVVELYVSLLLIYEVLLKDEVAWKFIIHCVWVLICYCYCLASLLYHHWHNDMAHCKDVVVDLCSECTVCWALVRLLLVYHETVSEEIETTIVRLY